MNPVSIQRLLKGRKLQSQKLPQASNLYEFGSLFSVIPPKMFDISSANLARRYAILC